MVRWFSLVNQSRTFILFYVSPIDYIPLSNTTDEKTCVIYELLINNTLSMYKGSKKLVK